MTHLFLFTIGPVQSFIAQARKTMDLKAGSDMLSKLTLAGIQTAQNQFGAELIFPYLPRESNPESMPNKFLAEVKVTEEDARIMGQKVEESVREAFRIMADKGLKNMKPQNAGQAFRNKFFEQIESHLEVYWVFEQLENDQDYRRAYQQIERNLGAIKNLRSFTQLPLDEEGRKCSVSGERDALVFNERFRLPAFVKTTQTAQIRKSPVLIGSGEGLSAVVATKRFSTSRVSFPSVAEITAKALELEMPGTSTSTAYHIYKGCFDPNDWDGQFLFEENVTDRFLEKNEIVHKCSSNKVLREQLKQLKQKTKEDKLPSISSYYALLTFDGDRMGATWAGDKEYVKPESDLKAFQKALSKSLYHFAQKAKAVLDDGRGQTIYAGGDDFSGFVNLHYLFDVMGELRSLYHEEVHEELVEYLAEGTVLSFSAGVCIAHYKNPLGEVVRFAHKAQDYAKSEKGGNRDAFAFYLMKRSGEIQQAAMKWGGEELENLKALEITTHLMQEGCFSNTFIGALSYELMSLIGREKGTHHNFDEFNSIIEREIERLVLRSKIDVNIEKYLEDHTDSKKGELIKGMQQSVKKLFNSQEWKIKNFLHWLEIADFLTRQPVQHAN
jgi:CRISPR-associated protein Cmr2